MPETINLYYRRRAKNTARKSGNIEDFCVKWGCYYDFMIVLDADSLMNGKTMLKMAQLMENNQHTGIIQSFAVDDIVLYLDTHPDDMNALLHF